MKTKIKPGNKKKRFFYLRAGNGTDVSGWISERTELAGEFPALCLTVIIFPRFGV